MNGNIEVMLSKIRLNKARVAELALGLSVIQLTNWVFDYFLYPLIIYRLGILKGGVVMTFLSFVACIFSMKFYDWSKRDWLGIEAIKSIKGYKGNRGIGRLTAWVMEKGDCAAFLFLSVKYDPFITTVYLRQGRFVGMGKRDWSIFLGSLLFSNAYWVAACYMGITIFEWGWKAICG